jgi:hypothetical protein
MPCSTASITQASRHNHVITEIVQRRMGHNNVCD